MQSNASTNSGYVRWLLRHMVHHRILFIINLCGILLVTITRTIIPVRLGNILDSIISPDFSGNLFYMIGILLGLYLLRNFVEYATWMIGHNLGSKTEQNMRREFFESVQNKPLKFHDQTKTGDLQALATNDLRVVNTMISHGSFYIYPFVQSFVTIVLQIQSFSKWIAIITIPFLALYISFVLKYRKDLTPFSKQMLRKHADVTVSLQEKLNGAQITKAFGSEEFELTKFKQVLLAYRKNWLGENRVQSKFYPLLVLYGAIGTSFVVSCILIQKNQMTVGELTAVNLLFLTLIEPTNMIFWATKDMIGGFGASERLFSVISSEKSEITEKFIALKQFKFRGKIEFKNVSFAYPNNGENSIPVLKNVSFTIQPNQKVALVGPTGCGKTTLAKLLLRLYRPQQGDIFLDNQSIHNYPLEIVRQRIGLIEQDTFLFSESISNNIKFGKPGASEKEVERVAKLAHIYDFVENFSEGFQTVVGERGTRLSGGEKQRIAIARAFLTDPDILILDDSYSAIDSETEEKIGQAIKNILQNRTTIIITHRLHTIRTADLILVMKKGRIIAKGQHDDLIRKSEEYRKIFGKQLESTQDSAIKREER